jgi:uncharacterized protein (TIGR00255 family)
MRSMTGFGQTSASTAAFRVEVVIRSVNYRYLDVTLRLREELRDMEADLRELVGTKMERGRVDVSIELVPLGQTSSRILVNEGLLRELNTLAHQFRDQGLVADGWTFADVLRLPQVITIGFLGDALDQSARDLLRATVARAVEQAVTAREIEGKALLAAITKRLDGLDMVLTNIQERRRKLPEKMAADYEQRLRQWLGSNLPDPGRLAQETAMWVERTDVSEEIDRLASHLTNFRSICGKADRSLGKRLDFLAQELFRELNTIGSKCRDGEMVRYVIDGKLLCEEIREQLQNVE